MPEEEDEELEDKIEDSESEEPEEEFSEFMSGGGVTELVSTSLRSEDNAEIEDNVSLEDFAGTAPRTETDSAGGQPAYAASPGYENGVGSYKNVGYDAVSYEGSEQQQRDKDVERIAPVLIHDARDVQEQQFIRPQQFREPGMDGGQGRDREYTPHLGKKEDKKKLPFER